MIYEDSAVDCEEIASEMGRQGYVDAEAAAHKAARMLRQASHALQESVKLQSHYAKLLNMHDGGERLAFDTPEEWIGRLIEIGRIP